MKALRKLLKLPLQTLLAIPGVLRRLAFEIREKHFDAVRFSIPLSHGYTCPIPKVDSAVAFSEMFVADEYGDFLDHVPVPHRWLDIGCHAGYFTLYLAWQHLVRGYGNDCKGLLVDADSRIVPLAQRTLAENNLESRFILRHGAISESGDEVRFGLREFMASSISFPENNSQDFVQVPVIKCKEITTLLAPPYDLVKLDIEGAETDFITSYRNILAHAKYVLLEWHTWNRQGWDESMMRNAMEDCGYERTNVIKTPSQFTSAGKVWYSGIDLYRNSRFQG